MKHANLLRLSAKPPADVMLSRILAADKHLAEAAWRPAPWLRRAALLLTYSGDGWSWCMLTAVILTRGGAERWRALAAMAVAVLVSQVVTHTLKWHYRRERPFRSHEFSRRAWDVDGFSFPSGHAVTAFAVAFACGGFYPSFLDLLLLQAAGIAASRLLLRLHFLTDVLVGCLIGSGLGLVAAGLLSC